jgi:hypothetical protein
MSVEIVELCSCVLKSLLKSSRQELVRTGAVVGAVGALGVVFVVGSVAAVSEKEVRMS